MRLRTGEGFGRKPVVMDNSQEEPAAIHAGLTELLELKRRMLHTVWRYGGLALAAAVMVFLITLLSGSSFGADFSDWLRSWMH